MAKALWCAAVVLMAQAGCVAGFRTVTTEVRLRDPAAVAVRSENGEEVLPVGGAAAPLAAGRAVTAVGSSAAYRVALLREPDRSLSVEWATALPLVSGERHTIVPADGALRFDRDADQLFGGPLRGQRTLTLRLCTSLVQQYARYGTANQRVEPRECKPGRPVTASIPYALTTPVENIVDVRERTRHQKGLAALCIGIATVAFGSLAAVFFTRSDGDLRGGAPTKYALGALSLGVMLAFDLPLVPVLFARDRDRVLLP